MIKLRYIALAFLAFSFAACEPDAEPNEEMEQESQMAQEEPIQGDGNSLSQEDENRLLTDTMVPYMQKMDYLRMKSEVNPDSAKMAAREDAILAVVEGQILDNIKQDGQIAPDFKLKNQDGEIVSLSEEVKKNKVVLVWYRGGWCPYCDVTLNQFAMLQEEFAANGAKIIAISPQIADSAKTMAEEGNLPFDLLEDKGNQIAEKYGLAYNLPQSTKQSYEESFGLSNYNADDKGVLPLAGTYVIGKGRKIEGMFFTPDYRQRIDPMDILRMFTMPR